MSTRWEDLVANAILAIDTVWGGDVMSASGTGRARSRATAPIGRRFGESSRRGRD